MQDQFAGSAEPHVCDLLTHNIYIYYLLHRVLWTYSIILWALRIVGICVNLSLVACMMPVTSVDIGCLSKWSNMSKFHTELDRIRHLCRFIGSDPKKLHEKDETKQEPPSKQMTWKQRLMQEILCLESTAYTLPKQ